MTEYFAETNYYAVLTNVIKKIDRDRKAIDRLEVNILHSRQKALRLLKDADDEDLAVWFAEQCAK